ncbi:MAG: ArsC family reductase [Gammaproteobacteria bacterium]|nr:ArsC family reductase [Gammaproteobacteria bacterium]
MINVYGIKNCDTMKKAFNWLDQNDIQYNFHDFKKIELPKELIATWCASLPLDQLINKRGTTWRKLDEDTKNNLTAESAVSIIQQNPSVVKRPLIEVNGEHYIGFKPEQYQGIFS